MVTGRKKNSSRIIMDEDDWIDLVVLVLVTCLAGLTVWMVLNVLNEMVRLAGGGL